MLQFIFAMIGALCFSFLITAITITQLEQRMYRKCFRASKDDYCLPRGGDEWMNCPKHRSGKLRDALTVIFMGLLFGFITSLM